MAPRRRLDEDEEDVDRSAEYYRREREKYDSTKAAERKYGDSCKYLQKMIKQQWESEGTSRSVSLIQMPTA